MEVSQAPCLNRGVKKDAEKFLGKSDCRVVIKIESPKTAGSAATHKRLCQKLGSALGVKTRLLLCVTALIGAASTVVAQSNVFGSNVVGYLNIPIPANQYVMIANPLNTTNNTLDSLFPITPSGVIFLKWDPAGGYRAYVKDELAPGWAPDGNATLNPGEGGFYKSPEATTLTFVGDILQGNLTNTLPIGQYVIRSSIVPQAGTPTALGIPGEDGDLLQLFHRGYSAYVYDALVPGWLPNEPTIGVGESFWYRKAPTSKTNLWIRNFTVRDILRDMNPNVRVQEID